MGLAANHNCRAAAAWAVTTSCDAVASRHRRLIDPGDAAPAAALKNCSETGG